MSDLVAWLREQLDEDERVARDAAGVPWSTSVPGMIHVDADTIRANKHAYGRLGYEAAVERNEDRAHIARWDPARALAEVESKRKILETCATLIRMDRSDVHHDAGLAPTRRERHNAEWFLRLMTLPYRDRPGYDPAWGARS